MSNNQCVGMSSSLLYNTPSLSQRTHQQQQSVARKETRGDQRETLGAQCVKTRSLLRQVHVGTRCILFAEHTQWKVALPIKIALVGCWRRSPQHAGVQLFVTRFEINKTIEQTILVILLFLFFSNQIKTSTAENLGEH